MNLYNKIPNDWKDYYDKEDIDKVEKYISEKNDLVIYPDIKNIFNFIKHFKPEDTKVVIIGQDPYHDGNALGYAFGIPKDSKKVNISLKNIFTELENNYKNTQNDYSLSSWIQQGVLLLNKSLTVEKGNPNSHRLIWRIITRKFIKRLSENYNNIVFMLWGNDARELTLYIVDNDHKILESTHPSGFSANKGNMSFIGSNHFKLCNEFLKDHGKKEIIW